jgi:hypothetical protein
MKRRSFLRRVASAGLVGAPWIWLRSAQASGWGELPTDPSYWPAATPTGGTLRPDYKILELHLSGGLSHYETFYVKSDRSDPWFGLSSSVGAINWSGCGPGRPTSATEMSAPISGVVRLGPATKPLWPFMAQMRVVVMTHELAPHEVAIPWSTTGLRPGNPKASGLAAAIERRAQASRALRPQPYSYVLMPANLGIDEDSFQGFHATGLHGGQFRPVLIRIPTLASAPTGLDQAFLDALNRGPELQGNNPLLSQYSAQYRDRLRHRVAPGSVSRSSEYSAYDTAIETLLRAPQLRATLQSAIQPVADPASCVDGGTTGGSVGNLTSAALRTAARLLALDEAAGGARYVGVVDGGIRPTTGGGYDVHSLSNYPAMFTNLWNTMSELASLLHRPAPGVTPDPAKINLNDTIVYLNTEFGRTPMPAMGAARDHWPDGYVTVLIGGPVVSGTAGALDDNGEPVYSPTGTPVFPHLSTDVHAALLMLAGIDPFDDANFGVGDVGAGVRAVGGGAEPGTALAIRQRVLGF